MKGRHEEEAIVISGKSSRHVTLTAASLCNVGYILEDLYQTSNQQRILDFTNPDHNIFSNKRDAKHDVVVGHNSRHDSDLGGSVRVVVG